MQLMNLLQNTSFKGKTVLSKVKIDKEKQDILVFQYGQFELAAIEFEV